MRWRERQRDRERVQVEKVQIKYIKWVLRLDRFTPDYIALEKSERKKLRIRTRQRTMKFEVEVKRKEGRKLLKECVREKEEGCVQATTSKEREGYLKRNGVS